MPGLRQSWYPWPYTEGVTIAEATNELAFLSVGMYGKMIPKQDGAPIRLTLPWKYGFKSAKSIVKVEFTDKRPVSFWEQLQDGEYGFWANVNPDVPHPRWSQAHETAAGERRDGADTHLERLRRIRGVAVRRPEERAAVRVIAARILAVISAMFLVAAFALATLLPPEMPLSQAISLVNHGWLVSFQDAVLQERLGSGSGPTWWCRCCCGRSGFCPSRWGW